MSFELEIRCEPDYLHVQATGIRSMETVMAIAQDSIKACDKHGYKKMLIDAQRMTGNLSDLGIYEIGGKDWEKIRGDTRYKAAVVDLEENRDRFRFYETVLVNRGFNIRFFSKAADAQRWLVGSEDISGKSV
jgi:hypothetical protein